LVISHLGFTKEWLEHQYLVLGKSAVDIGKEIGKEISFFNKSK
jgi:hypothetical protein